jgi:hypothetical protein
VPSSSVGDNGYTPNGYEAAVALGQEPLGSALDKPVSAVVVASVQVLPLVALAAFA